MAFKLPMDGFKKVSEDKHKTILRHESGHEITIAHSPLSPKLREQLKKLPLMVDEQRSKFADGGKISGGNGSPSIDPKAAKEIQDGAMQSGWQPEQWKKNLKAGLGFAEGGTVPAEAPAPEQPSPTPSAVDQSLGSIIGHAVRTAVGDTAGAVKSVAAPVVQGAKDFGNALIGADAQAAEKVPVTAQPQVDPAFAQAQASLEQAAAPTTPTAEAQQAAQAPEVLTSNDPNEPGVTLPGIPTGDQPSLEEGYKNQVMGEQHQAQALAAQGERDAAQFQQAAGQEANLLDKFQEHIAQMNEEINNFMTDIKDEHINPHQLWDSKSGFDKARIGIGFLLSGMGAGLTGGPNLAVEMLNKDIDRDIDAQKANIGKSENLLSAMFKQYGNMRDAVDMTRILKNAQTQDMIRASAAKAQNPLAKAAAEKAIGDLQAKIAPVIYQKNMRQTLQGINNNGKTTGSLSHVDPATFLNLVPEGQRKEVSGEIERAQNTRNMGVSIMDAFDKASHALSGAGRLGAVIQEPGELNRLSGLLNTTITDLTGTARQAEFDSAKHNFMPQASDTPSKRASKRQALQEYLQAKKSAPLAKSYGIDLDKFASTNASPEARLTPQQQSFAAWAKANPGPKADMVLKKLGLK